MADPCDAKTPKRKTRRRRVILLSAVGGSLVLVGFILERWAYYTSIWFQMPSMAAAVYVYHQQYGVIPPSLRDIEILGGVNVCRYARNGFDVRAHKGPEILYLPVSPWDSKTEYVVAVNPPCWSPHRAYVIAGDTMARGVTEDELAKVLERDDKLRAATSQPGRWSQMPWRAAGRDSR